MLNLKLRAKIIGLAVMAAAIPTAVMFGLIRMKEQRAADTIGPILESLSGAIVSDSAINAHDSCAIANDLLLNDLETTIDVARRLVLEVGGISFRPPNRSWEAANQLTRSVERIDLPSLHLGKTEVPAVSDMNIPVPVVDEVTQISKNTCTIFQRMNAQGDMLRVATTVPTESGRRGIGTFIPVVGPKGDRSPVIAAVLAGETYRGRAFVYNAWYLTIYEPIFDDTKEVIGMLYVGIRQEKVPGLRSNLAKMRVGRTGYLTVFQAQGNPPGRCVISGGSLFLEGQNYGEMIDADGYPFLQKILSEAVKLKPGEVGSMAVHLRFAPGEDPQETLIKFSYFSPWDWVICASAREEDFDDAQREMQTQLAALRLESFMGGALALLLAAGLAMILGRRIAQPITELTKIAGLVADGDLAQADQRMQEASVHMRESAVSGTALLRGETFDETNQLCDAFERMIHQLSSLVGQVKDSSSALVGTATEISATSRQQERNVQDFGVSTNEIAAAVRQISATSQELLGTMNDVSDVAGETAVMADDGRKSLSGMEEAMRRLATATRLISSKLSVINEKANNIGTVINTISDVADQTDLISLNAAIEAEKAGAAGQGFGVVAREIRRLADRTAVATLDIEELVKEMQSAVTAGVMEMDKFTEEVRQGVDETGRISAQLARIIEQVQTLTPRFEAVYEGMQSQSAGAGQINDAMLKLTEIARFTRDSVREFNKAAEQLRDAISGLNTEVQRFKVISQRNEGSPPP
jgi:methyl-accepting chemotaxis protein WspA